MDPSIPGGISRALRGVERWLAARTPAQRARPGGSVLLERELRPISRELAALIFIEERLRRGGVGSLFAQDSSFLDGWSREEVRHRYLVVRATVDASLCRMESVGAGPESFYPGLVMGLAKPLELLHGAGDTAACPGTEDRGARAFRRLIADLERVPESELARHARLAQDVSRVDLDFEVLSSAERAEGLDRIERELAARLRGASRRHELVEVLARRAGLIRDSPEADQEARLREARAALARLVEVVPEALGEIPALIDDDDRKVFSSPPAYDAFLEDVRAAVRQAAAG